MDIQENKYNIERYDLSDNPASGVSMSSGKAVQGDVRVKLAGKMKSLNDTFPESTWYRENWTKNQ